jgi:CheY-like chemotaxis protein
VSKPVKILLVEDSERDTALLMLYLRRGGFQPTLHRVETGPEMKAELERSADWDIVISDFNLPRFNAHAALATLRESGRQVPFIVLSGGMADDVVGKIIEAGATHFILKHQMAQIVPIIERAIQARAEGGS